MNVISSNNPDAPTVGIVTEIEGLKNVGDFKLSLLEDWMKQIKTVFGQGNEGFIRIQFKLSDNPKQPGYVIAASVDGHEPHIVVCGQYLADGKRWE